MSWGDVVLSPTGGQVAGDTGFRHPLMPLPPLPESLDDFSCSTPLRGASLQGVRKRTRTAPSEFSLSGREEGAALEIPPIPALFDAADLHVAATPPSGEKAVMNRLKTHLESLEAGGSQDKQLHESHPEPLACTTLAPAGASCSAAAIPETFLKSQSGFDMAFVPKLPDSMLSIERSEVSGSPTQPGSRTSAEGSAAFADGNASDGFGFGEDSLAPALVVARRTDTSAPAANRSFSFGDVSLGLGSRTFGNGNASLPEALSHSVSLSGMFREFAS